MREKIFYRHYIHLDSNGDIVFGWSTGQQPDRVPQDGDIMVTDKGTLHFQLPIGGEPEYVPGLLDFISGTPLYHWNGNNAVRKSAEDIAKDRKNLNGKFKGFSRSITANTTETVLLETLEDHEKRLCLIELGEKYSLKEKFDSYLAADKITAKEYEELINIIQQK